jgi:hypothetical protein
LRMPYSQRRSPVADPSAAPSFAIILSTMKNSRSDRHHPMEA